MKKLLPLLAVLLSVLLLLPVNAALAEETMQTGEPVPEFKAEQSAELPREPVTELEAEDDPLRQAEDILPEPESGTTEAEPSDEPELETTEAAIPDEPEIADWTVMLYLSGAAPESESGLASETLKAIASTVSNSRVKVVIQTGGARSWHSAETLGIEIASDRLQRWSYDENGFTLLEELENANMARHSSLAAFLRWAAENAPAEKYMLSLWGVGGGSAQGLVADELYDGAVMSLNGLERALKNGGLTLDLLLADCGLAASLETCQAVVPWVAYLAASEEALPEGSRNCAEWLQSLYDDPACAPSRLGRVICDAAQLRLAELGDAEGEKSLTCSLIDLRRIGPVAEAFNDLMRELVSLVDDPDAFDACMRAVSETDRYANPEMFDLYDLARRVRKAGFGMKTAIRLETAVDEAVLCNLRGSAHPYSHGLSAYLCLNGKGEDLDRFAAACNNPWQLAFLDAITPKWVSPEWVEDETGEIPQLKAGLCGVCLDARNAVEELPEEAADSEAPDGGNETDAEKGTEAAEPGFDGIGLAYALIPPLNSLELDGTLAYVDEGAVCAEPEAYLVRVLYDPAPEDGIEYLFYREADAREGVSLPRTALGEILITAGSLRQTLRAAGLKPDAARKLGSVADFDYYFLSAEDSAPFGPADGQYAGKLAQLRETLSAAYQRAMIFQTGFSASDGQSGNGASPAA